MTTSSTPFMDDYSSEDYSDVDDDYFFVDPEPPEEVHQSSPSPGADTPAKESSTVPSDSELPMSSAADAVEEAAEERARAITGPIVGKKISTTEHSPEDFEEFEAIDGDSDVDNQFVSEPTPQVTPHEAVHQLHNTEPVIDDTRMRTVSELLDGELPDVATSMFVDAVADADADGVQEGAVDCGSATSGPLFPSMKYSFPELDVHDRTVVDCNSDRDSDSETEIKVTGEGNQVGRVEPGGSEFHPSLAILSKSQFNGYLWIGGEPAQDSKSTHGSRWIEESLSNSGVQ